MCRADPADDWATVHRRATIVAMADFEVVIAAGTLRSEAPDVVRFPHRWTPEGVTVDAAFTGAHLLHVAVAGCVLNDVYREAQARRIPVDGVRVSASGGFDGDTWQSTGIEYAVDLEGLASPETIESLVRAVASVAEIPKALGAGATVTLVQR